MLTKRHSQIIVFVALLAGCGRRELQEASSPTPPANSPSPFTARLSRPVYRHSVLPGGVASAEELKDRLKSDRVASAHYSGVRVNLLRTVQLDRDQDAYVSYRKAGRVYWTSKKVRLNAGEMVLASGEEMVRGRCGNRVSLTPRTPTAAVEPLLAELDVLELPLTPGRLKIDDVVLPGAPPAELVQLAMVTPATIGAAAESNEHWMTYLPLGGGGGGGLRTPAGAGGSGGAGGGVTNPGGSGPRPDPSPNPGANPDPGTIPGSGSAPDPPAPPVVPPPGVPDVPPGTPPGPPVTPPTEPPVLPPLGPPVTPPLTPPWEPPTGPPPTLPPGGPPDQTTPVPTPEPATLMLVGAATVAIVWYRARSRREGPW